MERIKIILVDDHLIVRDGFKSLLKRESNISIIGEAGSYKELEEILDFDIPDIIILDISLPDKSGIDITKIIKEKYPSIKIIILSMYTNDEFVFNALKAGANAYIPKNTTKNELLNAITEVSNGNDFISNQIKNIVLKGYLNNISDSEKNQESQEILSKREKEILVLCAEGTGNKEIADKLFISVRTVESHKSHIMQKLNLSSTADLIKYAIKNNYISLK